MKRFLWLCISGLLCGFSTPAVAVNEPAKPVQQTLVSAPNPIKRNKQKRELPYQQVVCFYPVKAFTNYIMMGYERQVGKKNALKVAAGYVNFEEETTSTNFNFDIRQFSGMRFDLSLKYFVGENNPVYNGIYVAPFVSFKNSKFRYFNFGFGSQFPPPVEEWEEGAATSFTGGVIVGYQLPLGDSFSLDLYVGNALKRSSGDYEQANRIFDPYKNAIGLISGFSVGFGF